MAERRSARANKGARYKEYVSHGLLNFFWEKEKPPVRHIEPTYPRKRTLKYILEQAAELPEIGEPDAEVYCRLYTTDEIDALLGLLEISRQFEEKRIPNQDEIDVALALMELSRTCEELSVTDQNKNPKKKNNSKRRADKTSKPLPKKRAKYL